MLDPEITSWETAIRDPRKWMANDNHVTWVLRYHGERVLITKTDGRLSIEMMNSFQACRFRDNRTPEELIRILREHIPILVASSVHKS